MSRRAGQMVVVVLMAIALLPSAAQAHQNPPGCNSNSLSVRLDRDRAVVRVGEAVTYTVYAANPGLTACDITDATIKIRVPAADGTATGPETTLAIGLDLPSNTLERQIGRVSTKINVNPGVTDAVALAIATGTLHDAPVDHPDTDTKPLGTTVVTPGIEVDKVGSIAGGLAPQNV